MHGLRIIDNQTSISQDTAFSQDHTAWYAFLKLLKRTRPRQPLNGVLVTMSIGDLISPSSTDREQLADAIRTRISELHTQLQIRLPVYIVLTKLDLLVGFEPTFRNLDAGERAQVWGMTFAPDFIEDTSPLTTFDDEFTLLVRHLDARLLSSLAHVAKPLDRANIFSFPNQLVSLQEPLREFLTRLLAATSYEVAPWLRGVYFTSAVQAMIPIDWSRASHGIAFGFEQSDIDGLMEVKARSFFVRGLVQQIILPESDLVSRVSGGVKM